MRKKYGTSHRKVRAHWQPIVDAGKALCAETVCLMDSRWIEPGTPWDLAHDPTGTYYVGPAHARCNRTEGSRRRWGKQVRPRSRDW